MSNNDSTSKMLALTGGRKCGPAQEMSGIEQQEVITPSPQLTPSPEMENLLSRILSPSSKDEHTPLK